MNNGGDEPLTLDEVTRRFVDSEQALDQVRQKLEGLTRAEEVATAASLSLRETADAVRDYVLTATSLVGEIAEAQHEARELLKAGVRLLDGSELQELKAALATVQDGQQELMQRLGDLSAATARAEAAEAELARVREGLSERHRKKLGL